MKKVALFAFQADPMCFVHVLLSAFDFKDRGYTTEIVIEGAATGLIKRYQDDKTTPFLELYEKAKQDGLVSKACLACTMKMGAKEAAEEQGILLDGEIKGHPSIATYFEQGYQVLTF